MPKKLKKLSKIEEEGEEAFFESEVDDDEIEQVNKEFSKKEKKPSTKIENFDEIMNKVIILQEMYSKQIENEKFDKSIADAFVMKITDLIQKL